MRARTLLRDIDPDPEQARRTFPEASLRELGQSLLQCQVQPLLVYTSAKTGRLTLLDGERRYRAATLVGIKELDTLLVDEPTAPGTRLQKQLTVAIQTETLAPLDRAEGIERLMTETGWTAARVAESLGISPATVSRDLAMLALPPEIRAQVASGAIPASAAYQLSLTKDPQAQTELAQRAAAGLPRDAVGRAAKAKATGEAGAPESSTRVTAVLGSGRQVTFTARAPLTIELAIEWLEELLAKARKFRNRGVDLPTFVAQLKLDAKATGRAPETGDAS